MAISPQRLTIYLYSTHRTVIFAIVQLSCSGSISTVFADFGLGLDLLGTDVCFSFFYRPIFFIVGYVC